MFPGVCNQVAALTECFATHHTFVRLFACKCYLLLVPRILYVLSIYIYITWCKHFYSISVKWLIQISCKLGTVGLVRCGAAAAVYYFIKMFAVKIYVVPSPAGHIFGPNLSDTLIILPTSTHTATSTAHSVSGRKYSRINKTLTLDFGDGGINIGFFAQNWKLPKLWWMCIIYLHAGRK